MRSITKSEYERLKDLERIVTKGKKAFIEVGNALREIRDAKLYQSTHGTFAAYVEERFGFKRSNAYHLIDAADAAGSLSDMSDKITNPRQLAEVAKAPADKRESVVELAGEIASERGKQPTAAIIAEARESVCGDDEPRKLARKKLPKLVAAFRRSKDQERDLRLLAEEIRADPEIHQEVAKMLGIERPTTSKRTHSTDEVIAELSRCLQIVEAINAADEIYDIVDAASIAIYDAIEELREDSLAPGTVSESLLRQWSEMEDTRKDGSGADGK